MLGELRSRLKGFLGRLILFCYGLLFFMGRLPFWIRTWITGGKSRTRKKSQGGKKSWLFWRRAKEKVEEEEEEDRQLVVAPSLLADPNIGRHMFVKIKVMTENNVYLAGSDEKKSF